MTDWRFKREWKREGKDFTVIVSCHEERYREVDGPYCWCIYAYIYPKHRAFSAINPQMGMWDTPDPGWHCGCTFFRTHYGEDGKITSYQIGCDYNHLYDDPYTRDEKGTSVLRDAEEIFETITQWGLSFDG